MKIQRLILENVRSMCSRHHQFDFFQSAARFHPWQSLVCTVGAIAWLMSASVWAENKDVSRQIVEDLIRSLDASTLAERSRAERQLMELGAEVLRFLPPPELIESPSAREAIRRLRPQLERQAARDSSAASTVSLQGEHSISEIVNEIARQTRNKVELVLESDPERLTVDWHARTFWDCLDDLCQRTGLDWKLSKDDAAIRVAKLEIPLLKPLAVQRSGPFRLVVESMETRLVIGDEQKRILRLTGRIVVEPRLRPLFLTMSAREIKARTNDEQKLPAWNPDAKYEFPVGDGGREVAVKWDFNFPLDTPVKAVNLRGQMHCQIAAATERMVFDEKSLVRGTIRRRGGVSVRLRHVKFDTSPSGKLNGDIGIAVSYDEGGPAFESHRSWMFHNAAYLESRSLGHVNYLDFDTAQQSDGTVAVDYRWRKINPPIDQYIFIYEAPTLILDVPVNVDLMEIRAPD